MRVAIQGSHTIIINNTTNARLTLIAFSAYYSSQLPTTRRMEIYICMHGLIDTACPSLLRFLFPPKAKPSIFSLHTKQ